MTVHASAQVCVTDVLSQGCRSKSSKCYKNSSTLTEIMPKKITRLCILWTQTSVDGDCNDSYLPQSQHVAPPWRCYITNEDKINLTVAVRDKAAHSTSQFTKWSRILHCKMKLAHLLGATLASSPQWMIISYNWFQVSQSRNEVMWEAAESLYIYIYIYVVAKISQLIIIYLSYWCWQVVIFWDVVYLFLFLMPNQQMNKN